MFNNKFKLLIIAIATFTQFAHAEVTTIQQEVLDNYMAMKNMSTQERKVFRTNIFENKNREQTKAYNRAFKQVRGILPEYLGRTKATNSTKTGKKTPSPTTKHPSRRVAGTSITYDTGTVTGTAGQASQMLGNRFDSALNPAGTMCCFPVESSGSVTNGTKLSLLNTFFTSMRKLFHLTSWHGHQLTWFRPSFNTSGLIPA